MMLLYLLITPRVSTLGRPGLGAPVPLRLGTSKKEMAVTKVVKEDKLCDQTYRGSASRGLQSPFLPVPLSGAHHFLSILAQDFSPGSSSVPFFTRAPDGGTPLPPNNSPGLQSWEPCAPAASHQRKKNIAWDPLRAGRGPTRRPRNKKNSQGHALGAFPPLLIVLF